MWIKIILEKTIFYEAVFEHAEQLYMQGSNL